MCGICGIYNFEGQDYINKEEILKMNSTLKHRGPDEGGVYISKNIGLGSKRLSIIDLKTGRQPVHNENKAVWVVFNGEIYNYEELREVLEKKGHRFYTRIDTEVIVHAYEEYGEDCVTRFNGMFTFAIWDSVQERLFLARDRLGIKPLFYNLDGKRLIFGSETKAILQSNGLKKREIDFQALHNFLSFSYIPTPLSIFRHIKKLPPGHILSCQNGNVRIRQYWDLKFSENFSNDPSCYLDKLKDLLNESIKKRLHSDVPIGVLLSGGLDSSIIVALVTKLLNKPVKTFTIRFKEASYDEGEEARFISKRFHTDHTEYFLKPDSIRILPELVKYFDEPYADSSLIPMYFISKRAKEDVDVILCGDGGDELFGGYDTYNAYEMAKIYKRLPRFIRRRVITPLTRSLPASTRRISFDYRAKRFVEGAELPPHRAHYWWKIILNEEQKRRLYSDDLLFQMGLEDSFDVFESYFNIVKNQNLLNQFFYVDMKTFMLDDNLVKVDRMSMANSLEARVPFLDHTFVEYALGIPSHFKVKGLDTKRLLRKAFSGILPNQILKAKKKGFTIPGPGWLKNEGRDFVMDVLSLSRIKKTGFFNPSYVKKILDEHFNGQCDNNRVIFSLLCFILWDDYYKTA